MKSLVYIPASETKNSYHGIDNFVKKLALNGIDAKYVTYSADKRSQFDDLVHRCSLKEIICILDRQPPEGYSFITLSITDDDEKDVHALKAALQSKAFQAPPPLPPPLLFAANEPDPKDTTKQSKRREPMAEQSPRPLITKTEGGWQRTPEGEALLEGWVTNTDQNVYAIRYNLSPLKAAAAMARLSRRGDDLRTTLLDEFGDTNPDSEMGLIRRVVSEYGDDSVQQLVSMHLVVEDASNLLTKHLEWGRLASYLEQSTRYIYFDKKIDGKYRYYRPELPNEILTEYESALDQVFDNYSVVVHKLTDFIAENSNEENKDAAWRASVRAKACDAARLLLPVATQSTVGIYGSLQAIESLIMRLNASDSKEARKTGEALLREARKVNPVFLERADDPAKGGAHSAYLSETRSEMGAIAERIHERNVGYTGDTKPGASLVGAFPHNELDLAIHMLYEQSDMSEEQLKNLPSLSYQDKVDIINTYMGNRLNRRNKPGRALERAYYSWDVLCDYGIFRDLQRHRIVSDLSWQDLTPRYGYEIPDLVEQAGLTELFESTFDLSLALHSRLKAAGYDTEAQYATLFGHRMRWKITMNAREAFHFLELRTAPQGHPGYRKLALQMYEQVKEIHPLIADAMKFINQAEDPALGRLAAERAKAFKLSQLGVETVDTTA